VRFPSESKKKKDKINGDLSTGMGAPLRRFLFVFVFWWAWDLNLGLPTCKAGLLLLKPHLQSLKRFLMDKFGFI
jgi:hypothetical protein